ncbi:hypothetical protein [Solicola gregarius]|uniref:Uncharacterized protein n=1 Tax=Solicola gregarius TaxID=2908642 RepID=A0AA46YLA9_9ACTN|nr:hypothetical protein [Solicola gregarius]UYM04693.1 hypothetical protein L0C25_19475 [Solicola gregarius]
MRARTWAHVAVYSAILTLGIAATASADNGPLPGRNKVGSADIINGEVHKADIAGSAVTGAKVRANTLTGSDVRESSLDLSGQCKDGVVNGYAYVTPTSSTPESYTSSSTWIRRTQNCADQPVKVKRLGVGDYYVRFYGSTSYTAQVTPTSSVNVVSVNWRGGGQFEVAMRDINGMAVEHPFTITSY